MDSSKPSQANFNCVGFVEEMHHSNELPVYKYSKVDQVQETARKRAVMLSQQRVHLMGYFPLILRQNMVAWILSEVHHWIHQTLSMMM